MANVRFIPAGILMFAAFCVAPTLRAQEAKKVTRDEAMSAVLSKVAPTYPPTARQLHIQGTVEIGIVIDEAGKVEKADSVSGNAMLTKPAVDALKQWKFKPFLQDGKPVKAETVLAVSFKL